VARAAEEVWSRLKKDSPGGISRWDASGAFFELKLAKRKDLTPSVRVLLLVYAADLAFRLRWQIQPALGAGQTVVAAPYIETAVAFGEAAGLPRKWLVELFRFAPKPDACVHVKEKKTSSGWKDKPSDGFGEFANVVLKATRRDWEEGARRAAAINALGRLVDGRRCRVLKKKTLREL
jgi:thymidylate kinase